MKQVLLVLWVLVLCGATQAQRQYVTFDAPGCGSTMPALIANSGAIYGVCSPGNPFVRSAKGVFTSPGISGGTAFGVSANGELVGTVLNSGFYKPVGKRLVKFQISGAQQTTASAVSHSGLIAGCYRTFNNKPPCIGYVLNSNENLSIAGASSVYPSGINNSGWVVGNFVDSAHQSHAFIWDPVNQRPIQYDAPGSVTTLVTGINDAGTVIGQWVDRGSVAHSFVLGAKGRFTSFDPEGAAASLPVGINDNGFIVGDYADTSNLQHGYLRNPKGSITALDAPGAVWTSARGIDSTAHVTGYFADAHGVDHGFIY